MIDRTSFIKKQLLECNVDPDLVENWCLLAQHNDHYFDLMFSWWEENNAEEKHKIIKKLQKKPSLSDSTNENLAATVVVYKSLGINKEAALECMIELENRKVNGSSFDFELYINSEVNKMKNISSEKLDVKNFLGVIKNLKK